MPPAIDINARKSPFWYYNTVTGKWRKQDSTEISAFNRASTGSAVARVPGGGWYRVDGPYITQVTEDGATRNVANHFGKTPPLIQHYAHVVGRHIVQIAGYYDTPATYLGSVHPLDDLASSRVLMVSAFPALSGWDVSNSWSAAMPDGRIVFGAQQTGTGSIGAFVLDWNKTTPDRHRHRPPARHHHRPHGRPLRTQGRLVGHPQLRHFHHQPDGRRRKGFRTEDLI